MLVSETVSSLIAWGVTGIIASAGILAGILLIREDSRFGLPIVGIGLLLALLSFAGPWTHGTPVLVVHDPQHVFARKDLRLYGRATYVLGNGESARLHWNSARQLVINDTAVPLSVAKVQYGVTFAEPHETPIGAYQVAKFDGRIDHFGPNDLPPSTSDKWTRYWLR